MKIQKRILLKFFKTFSKKPTLKVLAKTLSINETRMFRIIHGSSMRIDEYEKIVSYLRKLEKMKNKNLTDKELLKTKLEKIKLNLGTKIEEELIERILQEKRIKEFFKGEKKC